MENEQMDIIEMTRKLGAMLQQDDRYTAYHLAKQANDQDEDLQKLIGEFNLKRMAINTETAKDDAEKDNEKLATLNRELREVYAQIMANEHMQAYNDAKTALDKLTRGMMAILNMAAQGLDPDTYEESEGCSGNCGSCSGCH